MEACGLIQIRRKDDNAVILIMNILYIFHTTYRMYLGLPGLATDVYTLYVPLLPSTPSLRHPLFTCSSHTFIKLMSLSMTSYLLSSEPRPIPPPREHAHHQRRTRDHTRHVCPPLLFQVVQASIRAVLHRAGRGGTSVDTDAGCW
jgi:hypothetical protein